MPGVVGPEQIIEPRGAIPTPDGGVSIQLDIRFDPQRSRYVCHEFCAVSDPGAVTTEALRHVRIADWIGLNLLVNDSEEGSVIRELENPDGRDPWGLTAPDDVTQYGPTDRALRWVAQPVPVWPRRVVQPHQGRGGIVEAPEVNGWKVDRGGTLCWPFRAI